MDWTEAHRPRGLAELVGNGPAVAKLRAWADSWAEGTPDPRAVVLAGPPGTGKTSAALALARDMGWQTIELNASDARNADRIKRVATAGALHQTFGDDGVFHSSREAGRKLIVLDEADNLYERLSGENAAGGGSELSDRGGKAQIIDTIRRTRQPMVLIVNDLYALTRGSGSALNKLALTIKFSKINVRSIPKALAAICKAEGVRIDPQVLQDLAQKADGDLRAAVRDLESICLGRTEVTVHDLQSVGDRDTTANMFDVVRHILKGTSATRLRRETRSLDATPEDIVLWVDENLAKEYRHPEDLARGYEALSKADRYLGRARRTHNYRLWAYAGDMATMGVMTAREHEYRGFTPFGFPQWLSKMSRTRALRQTRSALGTRLGTGLHMSRHKVQMHQVQAFQELFQNDPEFAVQQTWELELDDEHVATLLGVKATSQAVKAIREKVQALQARPAPETRGLDWSGGQEEAGPKLPLEGSNGSPEKPAEPAETAEAPAEDAPAKVRPRPSEGQQRLF